MPTLYALLTGIDTYQFQRPLRGCVRDIERMQAYLQTAVVGRFDLAIRTLTDTAATREAVATAFREHLGQAEAGDVALFYYSGHGGQEEAAPAFSRSEGDGRLEGIVCYDSGQGGSPLLADKELRWLIGGLAPKGAHILTIFDACHSGDNTRSALQPVPDPALNRPRLAEIAPRRAWRDFFFADTVPETALATQPLEELLPQGRHVHLSACLDVELAYENDQQGGVFSHHLLEVLKATQGKLSYLDLIRRVRLRMLHGPAGISQHPQLYVLREYADDVALDFLGGAARHRPLRAQVAYNQPQQVWQIDKGQLHGLRQGDEAAAAPVIISLGGSRTLTAQVGEARLDHSTLAIDPAQLKVTPLDRNQTYEAWLSGLLQASLRVDLHGDPEGVRKVTAQVKAEALGWAERQLTVLPQAEGADYGIMASQVGGKPYLWLTRPGDTRPLAEQVAGWDAAACAAIQAQLEQVARWHFAYTLSPPESPGLAAAPIRLEVQQGSATHLPDAMGVVTLAYDDPRTPVPTTKVGFSFTNTTSETLYVAVLYLDTDFSLRPDLLEQQVATLPAGATASALGGRRIPVQWDPLVRVFNWPDDRFYLRVLAANRPFDVGDFRQKGLPKPVNPAELMGSHRGTTRSLNWDEPEPVPGFQPEAWRSQGFEIRLQNPYYTP